MKYIVGIDLGTTNSALAFIEIEHISLPIQTFLIPQLTDAGKIESLSNLPSFCYLSRDEEWSKGALKLPWKKESNVIAGEFAKIQGARVPTRLIQSAKSWLAHVGANRTDKILPLEASDPSQRMSPVEVSTVYLNHLKEAWNAKVAKGDPALELEEQEIILTVPASFDEVARALTVEAARQTGLSHVTLLEEPQAAFYHWISKNEKQWENQFNLKPAVQGAKAMQDFDSESLSMGAEHSQKGKAASIESDCGSKDWVDLAPSIAGFRFKENQTILVCDVGGGTTDFSLIEIGKRGETLNFQRMAVGDHLLLGGDNIDAALAHYIEEKIRKQGFHITDNQWSLILAEARTAKEGLLGSTTVQTYHGVLQGSGSSVVKGSISFAITREEIENFLLNGFFPILPFHEAIQLKKSRGIRTMGLPYEDDPAITKHLADFLHRSSSEKKKGIDFILFNGGTFKAEIFQEAIEKSLSLWFPETPVQRLHNPNLDVSVARGAAYYGKVKKGWGVSIGGGSPRSYYIKIEIKNPRDDFGGGSETKALTILSRGSEEGKVSYPEQLFSLRPNTPVSFQLLSSHVRLNDKEGDCLTIDPNEMQMLSPICTILSYGKKKGGQEEVKTIPVKLGICLTPIGTIDLWLQSQISDHRWNLQFQIRSSKQLQSVSIDETFEAEDLKEPKHLIESLFDPKSSMQPKEIMEVLEKTIGLPRRDWGLTLLRSLAESLLNKAKNRKLSLAHEARWWNLAGFFMRPGFGFPLDDFRMKELWKILLAELKQPKAHDVYIQMCICIRRLAGGFNKGQHIQLASEFLGSIVDKKTGKIEIKRKSDLYLYTEKLRALASLERLDLSYKSQLGEALVKRMLAEIPTAAEFWALGRIGARHLFYGSAGQVIPSETARHWLDRLLTIETKEENKENTLFLLKQLARKTDKRELNLPADSIKKIVQTYPELENDLMNEHPISIFEQEQAFGDQLPAGLVLDQDL